MLSEPRACLPVSVDFVQHSLLDEALVVVQFQRMFEQRLHADSRPL